GGTNGFAQGLCSAQESPSVLQLLLSHRYPCQALKALGQAVFVSEFPAQRQALLIECRRPAVVALPSSPCVCATIPRRLSAVAISHLLPMARCSARLSSKSACARPLSPWAWAMVPKMPSGIVMPDAAPSSRYSVMLCSMSTAARLVLP